MVSNFWSATARGEWPRDPAGYVFFGRAVLQIEDALGRPRGLNWAGQPTSPIDPAVIEHVVTRAESGSLKTAYRNEQGTMVEIPRTHWNGDVHLRFETGRYSSTHPFGNWLGKLPIFVDATTFFSLLQSLREPETLIDHPRHGDGIHLSPYMRLMIAAVRDLGITATSQPKKDEVIHYLETHWGDLPDSRNLRDAIATLVREPGSQKGRGAKELG